MNETSASKANLRWAELKNVQIIVMLNGFSFSSNVEYGFGRLESQITSAVQIYLCSERHFTAISFVSVTVLFQTIFLSPFFIFFSVSEKSHFLDYYIRIRILESRRLQIEKI